MNQKETTAKTRNASAVTANANCSIFQLASCGNGPDSKRRANTPIYSPKKTRSIQKKMASTNTQLNRRPTKLTGRYLARRPAATLLEPGFAIGLARRSRNRSSTGRISTQDSIASYESRNGVSIAGGNAAPSVIAPRASARSSSSRAWPAALSIAGRHLPRADAGELLRIRNAAGASVFDTLCG
jgi:hypothetical protein